ncbi:flagellar protein FlaG [Vreelandella aquamarina]|uniref:flagellar protein FlaG n=1 Tax=Vreelandella aquamarina TaxID=77097 RepID=UPI00384BE070
MGPLPIDSTTPTMAATTISVQDRLSRPLEHSTLYDLSISESESTSPQEITQEALAEPIQRINSVLRPRGLEFDISEQSKRVITRVIDRETGDVIRQIPAEEVLLMAERLEELQGRLISLKI